MFSSPPCRRDSFRRGVVLSIGTIILQIPFSVGSQALASRIMGVVGFGEFGYLQTGIYFVLPLFCLPSVYGMPMYIAANPSETRRAHTSLLVTLGGFLVLGVLGFPFWTWFSEWSLGTSFASGWDTAALIGGGIALAYRTGVELLFVGQGDFARRGLVVLTHPLLFLLVVGYFFLFRGTSSGREMFYYWSGSLVGAAMLSYLFVRKHLPGSKGWHLETTRRLMLLGVKGTLTNLATVWLLRSSFLVAERRLSPVVLGIWTSIHTLGEWGRQFTGAIGRAFLSFAARQSTKQAMVATIQIFGVSALLLYAVLWTLRSRLTAFLFGAEFRDPYLLLVVAYPGIVASCLTSIVAQAVAAWGYPPVTYVAPTVSTLLGLFLWISPSVLTPIWFGVGFSISQLAYFLLCAISYQRREQLKTTEWLRLATLSSVLRPYLTTTKRTLTGIGKKVLS